MSTPRRLLILRHAKAVAFDGDAGDHARSLADRGRADAEALGETMRARLPAPTHALVSSAARTVETYALLGLPAVPPPDVRTLDRLYLADLPELLATLRGLPDEAGVVLLVGHNPGLHALVLDLARTGDGDPALGSGFPTCCLADFAVEGPWSTLAASHARLIETVRR